MKRPFYSVILMGAVAAALTLAGCKKEAAGIDLELNKESIDLKIGERLTQKGWSLFYIRVS